MNILGISAFYHDSAACLVKNGEIPAAAPKERITCKKHDYNFPNNANRYYLKYTRIKGRDLDHVPSMIGPSYNLRTLLTHTLHLPR